MAIATATTRIRATEDTSVLPPSPIVPLFAAMLAAFAEFIARERDIAGVDVWDPAFRGWLAAAEAAQDRLTDLQNALQATPIAHPADWPLKRATFLLQATLGADRPEEVAQLRRAARQNASCFLRDDGTQASQQARQMLARAQALHEDFLALDLLGQNTDADLSPGL